MSGVAVPQPRDDRTYRHQGRLFSVFSLQYNTYCLPVDDAEEERLDELHRILRATLNDHVVIAPFPPPGVEEPAVLDCGYGKGAWIDDLLAEHEDCLVTGIDIYLGRGAEEDDENDEDGVSESGIEEFIKKRWNLNASFRDDRSPSRLMKELFDLINSRFLADGINRERWSPYIGELKRLLKPGGWLQMAEPVWMIQSENGRISTTESDPLYRWNEEYRRSMERANKHPRIGQHLQALMEHEGFADIKPVRLKLKIGQWGEGSDASLGSDVRAHLHKTLETLLLWPCTGALQGGQRARMTLSEYQSMVRAAQRRIQDNSLKLYYYVYVVRGRRPMAE